MNDYTRALHQRFCQEPENTEEEQEMDFSPVWISLKTTVCASVITFVIGILAAWAVMFIKGRKLKAAVDGILTIPLVLPPTVLGRNTINNMQSGLIQGYIGMAERIVRLLREETGYRDARVIATGGLSELIYGNSDIIDVMDRTLTLRGLNIIYKMNTENAGKRK